MYERKIKGAYHGENPAMSDPDQNHTREALSRLEHLVVQDIFLTETAAFADVILPATAFPEKMEHSQIRIVVYSLVERQFPHQVKLNRTGG